MAAKDELKKAIEGTGEVAESLAQTATDLVKAGTADVGEIFHAVIELGSEGLVDVTAGVKAVFVGSVKALEDSGKTTEEAVDHVSTKALETVEKVGASGIEAVGEPAKKGIEEAKEVIRKPLEK